MAWLLLDEETGRVLRAGCKRLPATGEANDYSTKSEGEAVLEAVRDLLPGLPESVQLVESTDSLGWKVKYDKLVSGQVTQRRETRQPDTGTLRAVHREAGQRILRVEWQPADHNLQRHDDRRRHAQCQANKAVDAGAGSAAEGGRDQELDFFGTHIPPPEPDGAYFSHGGAPVTGDIRHRVQRSIGLRNAALAMAAPRNGKGRAGMAARMAERGDVDATATAMAFAQMSPATQAAATRARLGRTRSEPSELLRRQRSTETRRLGQVLAAGGKVDRRCACGSGMDETRTHWRTECKLAEAAMGGVARVTSEELATQARAFWFDPEQRRGYWDGAGEAAAIGRAGGINDGLERVGAGGQAERLRLKDGDGTAAVVTRERLACLGARWTGGGAASMRRAVGEALRACLRGAPRHRDSGKPRRQDAWRPGVADSSDAQDGETARAEAAQEEREEEEAAEARATVATAEGPEAWLKGIERAERVAVHDEGVDDEERLAACAHVLGFAPGTGLDRVEVGKQFHRLALRLHPNRAQDGGEEAFGLMHGAIGFMRAHLKGKHSVRAPGRWPRSPCTPQPAQTPRQRGQTQEWEHRKGPREQAPRPTERRGRDLVRRCCGRCPRR